MSSHPYHTRAVSTVDLFTDDWNSAIVPLLPATLDAHAHTSGALIRKRAFACAADLLRGLLAYVLVCSSLRELGAWGVLAEVADISAPAWLKRLRAAGPFLLWLLGELLHHAHAPRLLTQRLRRVRLVDATTLKTPGGTGDDWRVHTAYDFLAGRISDVVLTDRKGGETLAHFSLQAGELLVADGGYGTRANVVTLHHAHADGLLRIYPTTFPLQRSDGTTIDVVAWLRAAGPAQRSRLASCCHGGQRVRVRVLAQRLDEARRRAALRRVRQRAVRRGRQPSAQAQFLAGWVVLVSTLTDTITWPDSDLWRVYAARWQIERLFKRMKQLLGMASLRVITVASAEAVIRALLVAWVLHEGEAQQLKRIMQAACQPAPATLPGQLPLAEAVVSSWLLSTLVVQTLRGAVRGTWTLARLRACLPQLQRFVVSHPRQRLHQESEVVAWLSGVRRTPRRSLLDAA